MYMHLSEPVALNGKAIVLVQAGRRRTTICRNAAESDPCTTDVPVWRSNSRRQAMLGRLVPMGGLFLRIKTVAPLATQGVAVFKASRHAAWCRVTLKNVTDFELFRKFVKLRKSDGLLIAL